MQENTIELNHIIDKTQKKEIKTVDELLQHVAERQAYFTSTLAAIVSQEKYFTGRQIIGRNNDGTILKQDVESEELEGIFTGQYWCATAAVAIGEALENIAATNGFQVTVEIANISTDFFAEDGPNRTLQDGAFSHTILKVTDPDQKSHYIDPTYAQVDHRFSGKIVIIPEHQFNDLYKSNKTTPNQFEPLSSYHGMRDAKALLKPEALQRLEETLL
jgi:hypothetical protein